MTFVDFPSASPVTIDIKTRFIADDTRVYLVFPGPGYRYFQTMQNESVVFLNLPGFPIAALERLPDREAVIRGIVVSDRVREWHKSGAEADKEPERQIDKITDFRRTKWREQFAAIISNFFSQPRKGDIFIVPGPNEDSPVLFGEIVDETDPFIEVDSLLAGEKIFARKVKWVREVQRRAIPRWLDKKIPSPNPVRQVERDKLPHIFDLMYERYYYDGHFVVKFETTSREFNALDNYLINQVFLYVAALHEHLHDASIGDVANRPIWEVVSGITFSEDIPEQRLIIQSPGYIALDARNIIPLVVGVFMTLSSATAASQTQPTPPTIVNTIDDSEPDSNFNSDWLLPSPAFA
ncbi:hypothetical protein K9U39_06905 [Rhodoblastus acidophilus]|uniref:Uncharacterized protein n=1 Tax=Candidatus Rhodoblastus alkanivorans TaxID=2954117 RepID=A0ABS9Z6R4_9HYPH|nr:hypothetical protein [Candidatus Rhodoblastus alkanivorans]MCI4680723.1 hypothetical protein [Candidatus Rhodoblastus alkanivorans]MCI4683368.1 hypothetical protein [Candidatus Rhodoblastus alkanivorans]MDI4640680.1 hypothetical protein [Rhodoblastus acidophilus]